MNQAFKKAIVFKIQIKTQEQFFNLNDKNMFSVSNPLAINYGRVLERKKLNNKSERIK